MIISGQVKYYSRKEHTRSNLYSANKLSFRYILLIYATANGDWGEYLLSPNCVYY